MVRGQREREREREIEEAKGTNQQGIQTVDVE